MALREFDTALGALQKAPMLGKAQAAERAVCKLQDVLGMMHRRLLALETDLVARVIDLETDVEL